MKEVDYHKYCRFCQHLNTSDADEPCNECLTNYCREDSHKPIHYTEDPAKAIRKGMDVYRRKIKEYLYLMEYTELDYKYADEYYKKSTPIVPMACSSVRNGPLHGRKLDWVYSDSAEFIVKTPRTDQAYATIGVAGGLSKLTDIFVSSNTNDPLYKIVPFQLYDGMNEMGLVANINVVPSDHGENVSKPRMRKAVTLSALQVLRYILDKFASAYTAARYIRDHMEIYFPEQLHKMHYELHYMISDPYSTYCVEFGDGEAYVLDISDRPYMTNFHLYGVRLNEDGTVYTPATQDATHDAHKTNLITDNGSGLERYNLIVNNYSGTQSLNGMHDLLNSLDYTRAYPSSENPASPPWYTEFVGVRDLTVASPVEDYEPVVAIADGYFRERTRKDGRTWHSVHSAIYDMDSLLLYLQTQENHEIMVF